MMENTPIHCQIRAQWDHIPFLLYEIVKKLFIATKPALTLVLGETSLQNLRPSH